MTPTCVRKLIDRALSRLAADRLTPAIVAPNVYSYLIDLATKCRHDRLKLDNITTILSKRGEFERELLWRLLPQKIRQAIVDERFQYDVLQAQKEAAVAQQNFECAVDCLNQQQAIARSIGELIGDRELVVTPELIERTLNKRLRTES